MSDDPYVTLSSRRVWSSPWYALREDLVRFPDGSQGTYVVIEKPDSVFVVPLTHDRAVVLIRNYRYTLRRWQWEVPAGSIEPGKTPAEAAQQELNEEVGGHAEHLEPVATFCVMPGIGTEVAHVFLAQGVTLDKPAREPSEAMERHVLPAAQVWQMALRGEIADGLSALAILLCASFLRTVDVVQQPTDNSE